MREYLRANLFRTRQMARAKSWAKRKYVVCILYVKLYEVKPFHNIIYSSYFLINHCGITSPGE